VDDAELRAARLVLVKGIQTVLSNGLAILGIRAPVRMEREPEDDDGPPPS